MGLSIKVKKAIANPVRLVAGIRNTIGGKHKNSYLILMYHRIIEREKSKIYIQDGMYVNPSTFYLQMKFLKENFDVLPLKSVSNIVGGKNAKSTGKPICAITFDDGWKDFYENAYPVLTHFELFTTVFLPTDLIDTDSMSWPEMIARILTEKDKRTVRCAGENAIRNDLAREIHDMNQPLPIKIEKAIGLLKGCSSEQVETVIDELTNVWQIEPGPAERAYLNWEEVKGMFKTGVVEFGSHTKNHRILPVAPEDVIWDELVQSRNKLIEEQVVCPEFIPFAYPNGDFTPRIATMVKESGYHMAVTTRAGWNRISGNRDRDYRLKRVGIHQDIAATRAMFACRVEGIY